MAQRGLACRFGAPNSTSAPVVAYSLSSGDVTVTVDGNDFTVTMAKLGDDRGANDAAGETWAGYVGSVSVTGLAGNTKYAYTATKGGNSTSGSFMTAPASGDDFCFYFAGCDAGTGTRSNVADESNTTGMWRAVKADIQSGNNPECAGILFVDDHGYIDSYTGDDSAYTGKQTTGTPQTTAKQYDYGVGYLAFLGLLGDSSIKGVNFGHDEYRQWVHSNLNYMPQWGDHEFASDFGWEGLPRTDVTGSPSKADIYTSGKAVWDAVMAPLQGASNQSSDTNANHWGVSLGDAYLFTMDGITNNSAGFTAASADYEPGTEKILTTMLGTNQIADTLTAVDTANKAFNFFGLQHSIKYMTDDASAAPEANRGAQHPIKDHHPTEYARLFTDTGESPKSLMDNPVSNGRKGSLVCLHSDHHTGYVLRHNGAGEQFYSICMGTVNGSWNFSTDSSITDGGADYSFDGTAVEWNEVIQDGNDVGPGSDHANIIRVDVYGSEIPKRMEISLISKDYGVVWKKKFLNQITYNDAVDLDKSYIKNSSTDIGET